jgi:hypothetical protein
MYALRRNTKWPSHMALHYVSKQQQNDSKQKQKHSCPTYTASELERAPRKFAPRHVARRRGKSVVNATADTVNSVIHLHHLVK